MASQIERNQNQSVFLVQIQHHRTKHEKINDECVSTYPKYHIENDTGQTNN